mgnify:CR=1 FL=1
MKLSVFLFLLLFMLPRGAMADMPPYTWNPATGKMEYDPDIHGGMARNFRLAYLVFLLQK